MEEHHSDEEGQIDAWQCEHCHHAYEEYDEVPTFFDTRMHNILNFLILQLHAALAA